MGNRRAQTLVTELRPIVILTQVISQVALAVIQIPAISPRVLILAIERHPIVILTRVISQVALAVIQIPAISQRGLMQVIDQPRTVIQIPATVLVDSLSKP